MAASDGLDLFRDWCCFESLSGHSAVAPPPEAETVEERSSSLSADAVQNDLFSGPPGYCESQITKALADQSLYMNRIHAWSKPSAKLLEIWMDFRTPEDWAAIMCVSVLHACWYQRRMLVVEAFETQMAQELDDDDDDLADF